MAFLGNINREVAVNNNPAGGGGVTILPDDEYELEAFETDVTANSGGTGKNFDFKVKVIGGPNAGVWFFGGITSIEHTSAAAQTIAQGTLRAMSEACGVDFSTIQDTKELEYRPFFARVGSETYFSKKHGENKTKNVILQYLYEGMPEETAPAPPTTKAEPTRSVQQPVQQQAAPPAEGRRTWQKRA